VDFVEKALINTLLIQ